MRLLVWSIQQQSVKKLTSEKIKRHNNKLYNLWRRQKDQVPDCIENISSKVLTLTERNALLYGLNHRILPKTVDSIALKANVDSQINRVCFVHKITLSYDNREKMREATDKFVHEAERVCNNNRNKFIHRTLGNLSKNKELKICKMDKGTGVVLMDKHDYYNKLDQIVSDTGRFQLRLIMI